MFHKVYQLTLAFRSEIALTMALLFGLNVAPIFAQDWSLNGNAATNSNNFLGTTDNIGLSIRTNNVTRVTIDRYGNVNLGKGIISIGSSNFLRAINVGANLEVYSLGSNFSPIVSIATPDAADFVQIIGARANDRNSYFAWKRGALRFGTNSYIFGNSGFSEKMRITEAGDVGIGTPNPVTRFHVEGNRIRLSTPGNANRFVEMRTDGEALDLNSNGADLYVRSNTGNTIIQESSGNVGIGTTSPGAKLDVAGTIRATGLDVRSPAGIAFGPFSIGAADNDAEGAQIIWTGAGNYSSWVTDLYRDNFRLFVDSNRQHTFEISNIGTGVANLAVEGNLNIGGTIHATGLDVRSPAGIAFGPFSIGAADNDAEGAQIIWTGAGNHSSWVTDLYRDNFRLFVNSNRQHTFEISNIGTGVANLSVEGTTTTRVLTITGGADLAEPFAMSDNESLEPGSVVIIDEVNPGQLKLSEKPYDTRVAGIVSGAGGVNPGLTLSQENKLGKGQNVALSGRVYVKATTANGAIKPGDLLTTSDAAGYAMKVGDHAKAQGAIIGKAMTALSDGTGLVLVLVSLQ